jgi:hypothetical protein
MFAVFNRPISRRSSCTLWRNSSIVVATVRFYTRGVRAVHKTEHLSAVFGSITPVTPYPGTARGRARVTAFGWPAASLHFSPKCSPGNSHTLSFREKFRLCGLAALQTQALPRSVGRPTPIHSDGLAVNKTALIRISQKRNHRCYIIG